MLDEKGRERNPRLKSLTDFIGGDVKEGILDTVEKEKAYGDRIVDKSKAIFRRFDQCHQLSWDEADKKWVK